MGAYSAQRPSVPRVPTKASVALTSDNNGLSGIWVSLHGNNVKFEITPLFIGTDKREPVTIFADKSQAVAFCNGVIEIIKGQDTVDAWIQERVKTALHILAENTKHNANESND